MAEAFYRVGSNLSELKEEFKCLRPEERKALGGWAGFCKMEFGFTKQYVGNLTRGAIAYDQIKTETVVSFLPTHEKQVRPLTQYNSDPKLQAEIWKSAVDASEGTQPTEQDVRDTYNILLKNGKGIDGV